MLYVDDHSYDHRVNFGSDIWWITGSVDRRNMTAKVHNYTIEGVECEACIARDCKIDHTIVTVPIVFTVCPVCEGRGTHVNPSIDGGGLSREDFDNDPEFEEDYFSGFYDVRCGLCEGHAVIPTPDIHREAGRAIVEVIEATQASLAEMYALEAMERRMGA